MKVDAIQQKDRTRENVAIERICPEGVHIFECEVSFVLMIECKQAGAHQNLYIDNSIS